MPKLCAAGIQLREQVDDDFPGRDRRSDGWIADARHLAQGNSDHIPDERGIVRGLDIDANLNSHPEEIYAFVEKLRKCAKTDKRIKYIIHDGKIFSIIGNWKPRKYSGINPHRSHVHISFTTKGDTDRSMFNLDGEINDRPETNARNLAKDIPSLSSIDLPCSRSGCQCDCHRSGSQRNPEHHQLA